MVQDKNDNDVNPSEMRSEFCSAITRLIEVTEPSQQVSACIDALVQHVDRLGIDINREYANMTFQKALEGGHLCSECMDWWDEVVCEVRYPVACCHISTGTLPGGSLRNTVAAISVYDRDGNAIGHDFVEWADYAAESDAECHRGFSRAINQAAARLGARSRFTFNDGILSTSVSIAHHPEQGDIYLCERTYRPITA